MFTASANMAEINRRAAAHERPRGIGYKLKTTIPNQNLPVIFSFTHCQSRCQRRVSARQLHVPVKYIFLAKVGLNYLAAVLSVVLYRLYSPRKEHLVVTKYVLFLFTVVNT